MRQIFKRKTVLVFLVYILSISAGFSQAYFGVRAGGNANAIAYDQETYKKFYNTKISFGYSGGVVFLYENKEIYGFYTELLFTQIGKSIDSDANDYETQVARYNYLEAPVMFRVRFHQPKFDWFLQLGPQLSYWLGGKGEFEVYDPSRDEITQYPYTINFGDVKGETQYLNVSEANRIQLSFTVGGGMIWKLENANYVSFDIRFAYGNSYVGGYEAASMPNIGLVDNLEYTNNVLTLSAVYYFNILEKIRLSKNKYRRR